MTGLTLSCYFKTEPLYSMLQYMVTCTKVWGDYFPEVLREGWWSGARLQRQEWVVVLQQWQAGLLSLRDISDPTLCVSPPELFNSFVPVLDAAKVCNRFYSQAYPSWFSLDWQGALHPESLIYFGKKRRLLWSRLSKKSNPGEQATPKPPRLLDDWVGPSEHA